MFYSRPKIEPLGWDLTGRPEPESVKYHLAVTSDGRPVEFHFGGGWLTASIGAPGAGPESPLQTVVEERIAPFGIMDITAEQICDILGVTIAGRKVAVSPGLGGGRGFDWSGDQIYWFSEHQMLKDEALDFIDDLARLFPATALLQYSQRGKLTKWRRVPFCTADDSHVLAGILPDDALLAAALDPRGASFEVAEAAFCHPVHFSRRDAKWSDPAGFSSFGTQGAEGLGLSYDVNLMAKTFSLTTRYATARPEGQAVMDELGVLLGRYFCENVEAIDLQTGAVLPRKEGFRPPSYSRDLESWCLEKPRRYLSVGAAVAGTDGGLAIDGSRKVFYGLRPAA